MGSARSAAASFHHAGGGFGVVAVRVGVGGLGELFQGGLVLAQGVADAGDEVGELGELVVVVGELLRALR